MDADDLPGHREGSIETRAQRRSRHVRDGRPGNRSDYCALGATPLWAFHGALDDTVDPQGSIEPMEALQACAGVPADQAKLTVYRDRDHNSWDPAYYDLADNDIYSWMLAFTKP